MIDNESGQKENSDKVRSTNGSNAEPLQARKQKSSASSNPRTPSTSALPTSLGKTVHAEYGSVRRSRKLALPQSVWNWPVR